MRLKAIERLIVQEWMSPLEWWIDVGALHNHSSILHRKDATIRTQSDLTRIHNLVMKIIIDTHCCNDPNITTLILKDLPFLLLLDVGSESFMYVEEVQLIGLRRLQRAVFGTNSFTTAINRCPTECNPNRCFYVKDCPALLLLLFECYSFSDYAVCKIKDTPLLSVIAFDGTSETDSYNFYYASLKLKDMECSTLLIRRLAETRNSLYWSEGVL